MLPTSMVLTAALRVSSASIRESVRAGGFAVAGLKWCFPNLTQALSKSPMTVSHLAQEQVIMRTMMNSEGCIVEVIGVVRVDVGFVSNS